MLRSLLLIQVAKAQPPAQATRPPRTFEGRALPAGAPLNTVYLAVRHRRHGSLP